MTITFRMSGRIPQGVHSENTINHFVTKCMNVSRNCAARAIFLFWVVRDFRLGLPSFCAMACFESSDGSAAIHVSPAHRQTATHTRLSGSAAPPPSSRLSGSAAPSSRLSSARQTASSHQAQRLSATAPAPHHEASTSTTVNHRDGLDQRAALDHNHGSAAQKRFTSPPLPRQTASSTTASAAPRDSTAPTRRPRARSLPRLSSDPRLPAHRPDGHLHHHGSSDPHHHGQRLITTPRPARPPSTATPPITTRPQRQSASPPLTGQTPAPPPGHSTSPRRLDQSDRQAPRRPRSPPHLSSDPSLHRSPARQSAPPRPQQRLTTPPHRPGGIALDHRHGSAAIRTTTASASSRRLDKHDRQAPRRHRSPRGLSSASRLHRHRPGGIALDHRHGSAAIRVSTDHRPDASPHQAHRLSSTTPAPHHDASTSTTAKHRDATDHPTAQPPRVSMPPAARGFLDASGHSRTFAV